MKTLNDKMLAAIDAYFSASDAVEQESAENLLLDVRDEINKHKGKELLNKLAVKTYSGGKAWHVAPTQPLSDYINAASIGGNDCPHVVVEKLQKAIDAEAMKGQK